MGDHATDHAPHHAGGVAEVVGALGGVGQAALDQLVRQAHCGKAGV